MDQIDPELATLAALLPEARADALAWVKERDGRGAYQRDWRARNMTPERRRQYDQKYRGKKENIAGPRVERGPRDNETLVLPLHQPATAS